MRIVPAVAFAFVLGVACDESAPRPAAVDPVRAPRDGSAVRPVAVDPVCTINESLVGFHVAIDTRYSKPEARSERALWVVICNRTTSKCDGYTVRLDGVDHGRPIGIADSDPIRDAELLDVAGSSTATVRWARDSSLLRTFTIDMATRQVTYAVAADDGQIEGRGSGPCQGPSPGGAR